jgi:molybdate-binding protein
MIDYLKLLDEKQHQLIYVVRRNQGLMVTRDNPKQITDLSSLTQDGVTFINRQTGSATRTLFDQLIAAQNISSEDIRGYSHEEFTHMAVAAMVASGAADIGFGIAPIADKFNLEFIPLVWEHYCLAVPQLLVDDPRVQAIISLLKSPSFHRKVKDFKGYDTTRSGQLVDFDEIFA